MQRTRRKRGQDQEHVLRVLCLWGRCILRIWARKGTGNSNHARLHQSADTIPSLKVQQPFAIPAPKVDAMLTASTCACEGRSVLWVYVAHRFSHCLAILVVLKGVVYQCSSRIVGHSLSRGRQHPMVSEHTLLRTNLTTLCGRPGWGIIIHSLIN